MLISNPQEHSLQVWCFMEPLISKEFSAHSSNVTSSSCADLSLSPWLSLQRKTSSSYTCCLSRVGYLPAYTWIDQTSSVTWISGCAMAVNNLEDGDKHQTPQMLVNFHYSCDVSKPSCREVVCTLPLSRSTSHWPWSQAIPLCCSPETKGPFLVHGGNTFYNLSEMQLFSRLSFQPGFSSHMINLVDGFTCITDMQYMPYSYKSS